MPSPTTDRAPRNATMEALRALNRVDDARAEAQKRQTLPPAANVTNYHGPVVTVNGNHAQMAWNNRTVNQRHSNTSEIAAGYERLAGVVTDLLASLPRLDLDTEDDAEVRAAADTVLAEVVEDEPDISLIKRGLNSIKGYLAQIAAGTAQAATDESIAIARTAITGLSTALPL